MRRILNSLAALPPVAALVLLSPVAGQRLVTIGTAEPKFTVAAERVHDVDGDGSDEVLLLGRHGEVRVLDPGSGELHGTLTLPHPERSLVTIARLRRDKRSHLIHFSPDGLRAYAWGDKGFAGPARRLLSRGRFSLRVGEPRFADIAQDVNGDGLVDLVVPSHTTCTLYLNRTGKDDPRPKFVRASQLTLRVQSSASTKAERLSDKLAHSVRIPSLRTQDVNGDGRGDLVVEVAQRRHFHLQRADGAFPDKPDVVLDLARFRDTTPKAELDFGRTLAQDRAQFHSNDLDGDGVLDYVIAHRRKVWVYHGTKRGPQFEDPSKILILAEDVSFLLLMHLDDNLFPDLLVFKLQIPTLATLFFGLFSEWDIKIRTVGYENEGGKTFAKRPKWRSETTIRAPSILGLVSNPESIVTRFQDVSRKFRHVVAADVDGDSNTDVLLQTEDKKELQLWMMKADTVEDELAGDRQIRKILFEDKNRVWDIDRILQFMQSMANDRTMRLTSGRPPTGGVPLRDPEKFRLAFAAGADLDGDGKREIVLHYLTLTAPPRSYIDILQLRK